MMVRSQRKALFSLRFILPALFGLISLLTRWRIALRAKNIALCKPPPHQAKPARQTALAQTDVLRRRTDWSRISAM
jgi:hypothetical protein